MRVIIAGGTGLIGSALARSLADDGHEVISLTRNPEKAARHSTPGVRAERWDGRTAAGWGKLADGADAIVNLAGASIAGDVPPLSRWSESYKREILESRLNAGRAVVEAVRAAQHKPAVVVQSSAVGYYGSQRGDEVLTETTGPGDDFLAGVAQQWEAATRPVTELGVRQAVVRSGLVLSNRGGLFPFIKLQFKLFAGGPMGSGRQWFAWIHWADHVAALRFVIDSGVSGPVNLGAPNPVRYAEFARTLGKVLKRPGFIPAPAFALRLAMGGQKANELLLASQRMVPEVLQGLGFRFKFPELEAVLRDLAQGQG